MNEEADLEAGLRSDDPEERRRATAGLEGQPRGLNVELLLKALGDADWRVRKEAVAVACRAAPSSEVLRGLIESIGPGSNVGLRNAAVEAIAAFGADAVDAIAIALPNLDPDGRKLATEALANCGHPAAFLILEGLARDDDTNVRATAIEAVARVGASAPEAASAILLLRLKAEDSFERLAALDGLNQLGITLPWSQIEQMLADPILVRPALLAAGRSGDPRAAEPLTRALTTARGATFDAALMGLHDFVRTSESSEAAAKRAFQAAGAALEATLTRAAKAQSDQLNSRRIATLLLGCIESATAASVVVGLLADDSVTAEAEEALLLMGPACVDTVVLGLEQADPEQRARGVELLARMFAEEPAKAVVKAVAARLDDDDAHVVRVALEALAQLGDESTFEAVANKLVGARGAVRWSAETALAEIALRCPEPARRLIERATPQGKDAVAAAVALGALAPVFPLSARDEEFLTDVLAHESMFARRAALDALATGKTARAIDAVAFALTDEHREVQVAAIRTLGRMRDESGRAPGLAHLLPLVAEAPDQELLAHAVAALGDTGSIEAVRALRQLTRTAPAPVAVRAIEAIVRIPEIRHVDDLIDGLSHPSPEVVKAALGAISELNDPRVATHIGVCLDHEAWDVRRLAADLLGELGGESNVNLLRAKLQVEKEPLVKDALARALESLGALRRTPSPAGGSIVPR